MSGDTILDTIIWWHSFEIYGIGNIDVNNTILHLQS